MAANGGRPGRGADRRRALYCPVRVAAAGPFRRAALWAFAGKRAAKSALERSPALLVGGPTSHGIFRKGELLAGGGFRSDLRGVHAGRAGVAGGIGPERL